jgi:hypothetical protein
VALVALVFGVVAGRALIHRGDHKSEADRAGRSYLEPAGRGRRVRVPPGPRPRF